MLWNIFRDVNIQTFRREKDRRLSFQNMLKMIHSSAEQRAAVV
jgi:hypothetical protein